MRYHVSHEIFGFGYERVRERKVVWSVAEVYKDAHLLRRTRAKSRAKIPLPPLQLIVDTVPRDRTFDRRS